MEKQPITKSDKVALLRILQRGYVTSNDIDYFKAWYYANCVNISAIPLPKLSISDLYTLIVSDCVTSEKDTLSDIEKLICELNIYRADKEKQIYNAENQQYIKSSANFDQ